ncbi:MAG: hypothetical protein V3V41_07320 [Candidatus Heimdallarchaeota archaeon]
MALSTVRKGSIIALCIVIAIGSVFGMIGGFFFMNFGSNYGYIALIVVSIVTLVSAIFVIFYVSFRKRSKLDKRAERPKKHTRKTFIWIIVAIGSSVGAFLSFFLYKGPVIPFFVPAAVLAGVCLFAFFILISGRTERSEIIVDTLPPTDFESTIEE